MDNYITKKSNMKFQSIDALKVAQSVIDDASLALNDKSRRIKDSNISEILVGTTGVGVGAGLGFAGLYLGGTTGLSAAGITSGLGAAGSLVGGGMVAGIGVIAAPAVILGSLGVGIASRIKRNNLKNAKILTYKNAIAKQTSIIKALKNEINSDKERIEYLTRINILLSSIIEDLKHDLGIV